MPRTSTTLMMVHAVLLGLVVTSCGDPADVDMPTYELSCDEVVCVNATAYELDETPFGPDQLQCSWGCEARLGSVYQAAFSRYDGECWGLDYFSDYASCDVD